MKLTKRTSKMMLLQEEGRWFLKQSLEFRRQWWGEKKLVRLREKTKQYWLKLITTATIIASHCRIKIWERGGVWELPLKEKGFLYYEASVLKRHVWTSSGGPGIKGSTSQCRGHRSHLHHNCWAHVLKPLKPPHLWATTVWSLSTMGLESSLHSLQPEKASMQQRRLSTAKI